MGNSKKRKREEKNKTQLKKPRTAPGKHLPKGTNVTKTEFRVAKIVIPGHVGAPSKEGPTTSKKLGLKEVVNKLGHFSQTVRNDGLEGLKELLSSSSSASLVNSNLAFILTSLVPVTQDKERKIRRLAISLLSPVLAEVHPSLLTPLYPLLSAYLCCSLTRIDQRIQQDGLTMLDTFLDKATGFIRSNYNSILPNCLEQISNKKVSEKGPSVAANMSESMTALQWRVLVLTRVDKVLNTVVMDNAESKSHTSQRNSNSASFVPGLSCPLIISSPPSWFPLSSVSTITKSASSSLTNLKLLMPLLIETWVEARATESTSKKGSSLTSEVGDLLMCEVGVMDKLLVLALDSAEGGDREAALKLVEQKYLKDIQLHFLSHLPYTCQGRSADQANAILCCISLTIIPTVTAQMQEVMVGTVTSKNIEDSTRLRLAKSLLLREGLTTEQRDKVVDALVIMVETAGSEKVPTLNLLRDQAMKWPESRVSEWVESLPMKILSQQEVEQTDLMLTTCLELAKTCNKNFATQFLVHCKDIQDHLDNLDTPEIQSHRPALIQKLNFIKHHCDLCNPAAIA